MKILFFALIVFFYFYGNGLSSSIRSPEHNLQTYAQYAILLYHKEYGKLPNNWHELRQYDKSKVYVEMISRSIEDGYTNNFIENFRFIPSGTVLRIRAGQERVVAMASSSMVPVRLSGLNVPSRLLIVMTADGSITTRQYTEEQIAKLFELAGYDIAEYTGPEGKWQPEPVKSIGSMDGKPEERPDGDATRPPGIPSGAATSVHKTEADAGKEWNVYGFPSGTLLLLISPIVALIVWLIVSAIRRKRRV